MASAKAQAQFPRGNAKVGDKVWLRKRRGKRWLKWHKDYVVKSVAEKDEYGGRTAIRVHRPGKFGHMDITPARPDDLAKANVDTLVIPPEDEVMRHKPMLDFLEGNHNVECVRGGGNRQDEHYKLVCTKCNEDLRAVAKVITVSLIKFEPKSVNEPLGQTGFCTANTYDDSNDVVVKCGCREYTEFPEFENE